MGTEIAVRDGAPSVGLSMVDGPNPAGAVAYAAQVSTQIAAVLDEGNGYKTISGKKHITIEGWQSLAAMTGHSVEVEWSRPVEGIEPNDKGVRAWEARAVVRDQHGRVVAAGESMADPAEPDAGKKWARGGNFSVRSMAQTRAMSRALSSRMRYIVQLAGFSGTPAEEMGGEHAAPDPLAIARERWKVLRETSKADADTLKAHVGDDPAVLADDSGFAVVAFRLGVTFAQAEDAPEEGEVIDGQQSLVDEDAADAAWTGSAADPDRGES